MIHLLIIQSLLSVLVSYPDSFEVECVNKELYNLYRIIARTPGSDEIPKKENFLLILGHNKEQGSLDGWQGLIFTKKWQVIKSINQVNSYSAALIFRLIIFKIES